MKKLKVVCLCGSNQFGEEFAKNAWNETIEGHIVIRIQFDLESDTGLLDFVPGEEQPEFVARLETLNAQKDDMADEVFVINPNGKTGKSTRKIVQYAKAKGKRVRWLKRPKNSALGLVVLGTPTGL